MQKKELYIDQLYLRLFFYFNLLFSACESFSYSAAPDSYYLSRKPL